MTAKDAISMLTHPALNGAARQTWADLGSGTGTFTVALASLIPAQSIIYAIDKSSGDLEKIPERHGNATIVHSPGNFLRMELPVELDGILMANSLHYVKDQQGFVNKLKALLKPGGCMLFVEYDLQQSNPWVPHPAPFETLKMLLMNAGFSSVDKISEMDSVMNESRLYSVIGLG